MSIFDQTIPQSPGYAVNSNKSNNIQSKIQPYFGSLGAIDDNSIMDRQINRKPVESDSDDDEVGAWDGTIAPGEQPPRKLSSLGLNKTLSDLFRQDHGDGKDGGESDGSAVTTKAHLDHLGNGVPSTSSMSTSTAFSNAERGLGKKKLSLRGQKMFSEAHALVPTKPPAPTPASTFNHHRCAPQMPIHSLHLEQHFQRQQQQQRLREQPQRQQYSQFGQQQFHPYQNNVQPTAPPYATYPNAFQAWSQQPGMASLGYPAGAGAVPLVNNIMYNPAGTGFVSPETYHGFVANIGGMGERKTSFSSMPPATKKPKKKGPANPRSKGAWTKAEDQKLKKAIEQHGMGSWQTISKEVQTRTAEQCRVRCRSISALNPDKKKGAFNETEDNMLKKITMLLIRNDAPGSPKKQHYMALSAGFTNSAPAATGRKRKNAGKAESGNDEFWFRVANEFNAEMQKMNLQKPYERTRKQLKERWQYNLDPSLNRGKWTEKENSIILTEKRKYRRGGWSAIAKLLPGRTPDMVKQRFNELLQEKMERDIM